MQAYVLYAGPMSDQEGHASMCPTLTLPSSPSRMLEALMSRWMAPWGGLGLGVSVFEARVKGMIRAEGVRS